MPCTQRLSHCSLCSGTISLWLDVIQPRQMPLAEVPVSPPGLEAWLARQKEVASSLTEPMCATRLCQLALSRSERHSASCPSWKRGAEEEGLRGKGSQKSPGDAQLPAFCLWWWWWCWAAGTFQDKENVIAFGALPTCCSGQENVNEWQCLFLHWSEHRRPSMIQFSHQEDVGLMNHCLAVCNIKGCRRHRCARTWSN